MNINRYNKILTTSPSGLYIEPFFKSYDLFPLNLSENLYNGNFEIEIPDFIIEAELLDRYSDIFRKSKFKSPYWQDRLTEKQEDAYHEVRNDLIGGALILNSAWQTFNYDEGIAYLCGLLPFKLTGDNIDKELLSLWGYGMNFSYKLEAYQLLVDCSYDEKSYFASQGIEYFEKHYGSSSLVVCEIRKMLEIQKAA
jgi:hypothetical protein